MQGQGKKAVFRAGESADDVDTLFSATGKRMIGTIGALTP